MFVLVCPFDLSFESVDVPHVFIEIRAGQWVLLSVMSEGVSSVLLKVLFVREGRAMRWAGTLPLHLCQSFEVVITRVKAEFSFVVLEFVRVIEVEVTLKAGVIYGDFDVRIHIIMANAQSFPGNEAKVGSRKGNSQLVLLLQL